MQMLGRIRNVIDREITIVFDTRYQRCSGTIRGIECDLMRNNINLMGETVDELGIPGIQKNAETGMMEYIYHKDDYYKMWLYNELNRNISRKQFSKYLCKCIKTTGATINVFGNENGDIKKALMQIRKEIKNENAMMIAKAKNMDILERQELYTKMDEGIDLTATEQLQMEKYRLRTYYDVSDELVNDVNFIVNYNTELQKNRYRNLKEIFEEPCMRSAWEAIQSKERAHYVKLIEDGNSICLLDTSFKSDKHKYALDLLEITGFKHLLEDKTCSEEEVKQRYLVNKKVIEMATQIFGCQRPNPSMIMVNQPKLSQTEALYIAQLREVSKIIKMWFGYTLSKSPSEENSLHLNKVHGFFILRSEEETPEVFTQPVIKFMAEDNNDENSDDDISMLDM